MLGKLHLVWDMIGLFFSALPAEIVLVATFAFIGAVVVGFLGWLK